MIIELASQFIDTLSDPSRGARVNEEHAIRLSQLINDENEGLLRRELMGLRDPDSFSLNSWSWLSRWCRSAHVKLNEDLLVELCEKWNSIAFKAQVIGIATAGRSYDGPDKVPDVDEFPHRWLQKILSRATRSQESDSEDSTSNAPREASGGFGARHVETLLMALIFVDTEITHKAASVLLNQAWEGATKLSEFFWSRAGLLDSETRTAWVAVLTPPEHLN